jgi:hypothetical protein
MVTSLLAPDPFLFSRIDLNTYLQDRLGTARSLVKGWDPDALLRTPDQDAIDRVIRQYELETPVLYRADIRAFPAEDSYVEGPDGFGDTVRHLVAVRRYTVPFSGDGEIFAYRATTYSHNPPRGVVKSGPDGGGELQFSLHVPPGAQPTPQQIREAVHAQIDKYDRHLDWARHDVDTFNRELTQIADSVTRRKAEILQERDLEAAVGFPVRRREDADRYAVPIRRKAIVPKSTATAAGRQPFVPEPVLAAQDYEEAIRVLISSRNALERTPSMTSTLSEELIRDLLLVGLNTQFQGAAAGELFNGAGKTDILIRDKDRNIFIAECKIWKGPKTIADALGQLLDYLVWRDTKAALLLFIRGGNATEIIDKSLVAIEAHPNYKRTVRRNLGGDRSDFVIHAKDDPVRDIQLAFLPFVLGVKS